MGGSIFKHDGILGGIFPGFMWDPYRVTLELLRDPNVIILASLALYGMGSEKSDRYGEGWIPPPLIISIV